MTSEKRNSGWSAAKNALRKKTLGGPPDSIAQEVLEKKDTIKDQRDASNIDGDTSESETESEASNPKNNNPSSNGHVSPEKSSGQSEIDDVASNDDTSDDAASDGDTPDDAASDGDTPDDIASDGDTPDDIASDGDIPDESYLEIQTFLEFLEAKHHRELLATASEVITGLLEKMTLNAALLGYLDSLDILLAHIKDHSDPDKFIDRLIDELAEKPIDMSMRFNILNMLWANKLPIPSNPRDKKSKLEQFITGFN